MKPNELLIFQLLAVLSLAQAVRHKFPIQCFQCSWDAEVEVDDERRKLLEQQMKEIEDPEGLQGPMKPPFLGINNFAEMPSRDQLALQCKNCTKMDGTCARWTYYTNEQPRNVTWLCVNSVEVGCFVEKLPNQLRKEVCLCKDQDYCNGTGTLLPQAQLLLAMFLLLGLVAAAR